MVLSRDTILNQPPDGSHVSGGRTPDSAKGFFDTFI